MNIYKFFSDKILFFFTLFLLAFIPLYPKIPLLDIVNTWVYVRVEDFVVLSALGVWAFLLFAKKITLKTPITLPILLFWIAGIITTIHGVLLIFPTIATAFPNVAFLSMVRRIEYLSVFFIAYSAMKDKRYLPYVIAIIATTLLLVVGYGVGQKYFGLPAFLTMNEEFAKGAPIQLSQASRVPSTFAGHYDLAAYLVLVIPILVSVIFGVKNWLIKLFLMGTAVSGFVLLFMTVSRISFLVLFVSLGLVLFFQKKRLVLFSLPIIGIFVLLFVSSTPALLDRFGNTVKEVDVLVDVRTGEAIGHIQNLPSNHFKDKVIIQDFALARAQLKGLVNLEKEDPALASGSADLATTSAIIPFSYVPPKVVLLVATNASTGESLPQGTGYINLALSPVTQKIGEYYYEPPMHSKANEVADFVAVHGTFLIKRAAAYDLSFTTRFQGEWPNALQAFKRNILLGSGYGSISLAIDNNYFRMLGETGLLGTAAFFAIFLTSGIYIRKILPQVDSPLLKSFVIGFAAGVIGLALNAIFIDVFEASKVAFLLWLLTGVTLGMLHFYQNKQIDMLSEFKKAATSTYAVILYLCIVNVLVFSPMISNFFVGDDFTWLRWAADCTNGAPSAQQCPSAFTTVVQYFTDADGFFYRPGTKIYFLMMYTVFWLNQAVYHAVSLGLHFIVSVLVFLLAKKIVKNHAFSILAGFLFMMLSGFSEAVFWISSVGLLFTTVFALLSVLFYSLWEEKRNILYFVASLFSIVFGLLFHELGLVAPLLILLYKMTTDEKWNVRALAMKIHVQLLFVPLFLYGFMRYIAHSHWFNGDYSYNLLKLPFNFIGNSIGYFMLSLFGTVSLPFYESLRNLSKDHLMPALVLTCVVLSVLFFGYRFVRRHIHKDDARIVLFGIGFFIISLLPFLGLGNIAPRYSYMASIGFVLLFVFFIKKLYEALETQGKRNAFGVVTVLAALFFLLHIMQIQQIHNDWRNAGSESKRFLVSIDEAYADYWATTPMEFYLINVPIRKGEAWIFPVGIEDALWLVFRNPAIVLHKSDSVMHALEQIPWGSRTHKIFEFTDGGRVVETKVPGAQ